MLRVSGMNKKAIFLGILFSANVFSSALNNLKVPDGFQVLVFAKNIDKPRQMTEGNNGYIFVGSSSGKVYALKDHDENGEIDDVQVIADGFGDSSGVAFFKGSLFIAEIDKIWRIDDIEKKLDSFDKKNLSKVLVTDELPSDTWHGRKWIIVDDDGSILLNVGAPCNVCLREDERFATILRYKDDVWKIEARGVRNSIGFDIHPQNKKLYFTDNGRDWMGDTMPSCELNVLEESGDFFGFPFQHANNVIDPEFGGHDHGYEIRKPIYNLGAHVAPTGMEFYSGNQFPAEFSNNAFIALHGSWNSSSKVGYKVIRVTLNESGEFTGAHDFLTGFLDGQKVLGRPAVPFMLSDGSLLVSDDYSNIIYKISSEI